MSRARFLGYVVLTVAGAACHAPPASLNGLMDLADNDLLDLLLARKDPEGELDTGDIREVLAMLRSRKAASP